MTVYYTPLISIIVPVYDVECYLRKCVDSILAQTYTNIEVILVDDGSPDGCPAICDEYARKDERVVVIHQENTGVGAARNAGLEAAKGKYISFVDSDDWIEPDMYEVLYCILIMSGADISATLSCYWDKEPAKVSIENTVIFTPKQAMLKLLDNRCDFTSVWGKLFARDIIDGIRFSENVFIAEDTLLTAEAIAKSNKVAYINYQSYHYITRPNSATHGFKDSFWTILKTVDMIIEKVNDFDSHLGEYAANHAIHLDIYISKFAESKGRFTNIAHKKVVAHIRKYLNLKSWNRLTWKKKFWLCLLMLGRKPFVYGRMMASRLPLLP